MSSAHGANDHSFAIRQEIQRFESVHPSIYAIYDLIDHISDAHVAKQIREHVVAIEGKKYLHNHICISPISRFLKFIFLFVFLMFTFVFFFNFVH